VHGVPSIQRVSSAPFRLRDLQVDPATGLVSGPGGSVRLEPRVSAVLDMLAGRPRQLVTRSELLEAIWPGGGVYDEALTQCVYQLRQQLAVIGGDGGYRDLIATLPKRGYQLNADVSPLQPLTDRTVRSAEPGTRQRRLRWALPALLLALALWAVVDWRLGRQAPPGFGEARTIAVLPFLPLPGTQGDPVLERGIADTLIARLSQLRQLVVRPISAVQGYTSPGRDPLAAGRELGVYAVVDGSIQRVQNDVRSNVRLLRVADGSALWAASFDEPYSDIFSLQDAISDRVASALSVQLLPTSGRQRAQGGTADTRAYEAYLKGRFHLARLTRAEMLTSATHFREAVAIDPNYAEAWLGLANVLFRLPIAGEMPPLDYYPEAKSAALRALEIDSGLAEGYAILGWIAHWFEWDWVNSEALFKRAIEINPNDTESHLGYAHLLSTTGRREQALAEIRRARELNPTYQLAAALEGGFLVGAGRIEEALQNLLAAILADDQFWLTHMSLAAAYAAQGRGGDALAAIRRARELSGDGTYALASEVFALARAGRADDAREAMTELQAIASRRFVPPYHFAVAALGMDEFEASLDWLRRGYENHDPKMALLASDYRFRPLRDRPGFQRLLRELNLAEPVD